MQSLFDWLEAPMAALGFGKYGGFVIVAYGVVAIALLALALITYWQLRAKQRQVRSLEALAEDLAQRNQTLDQSPSS